MNSSSDDKINVLRSGARNQAADIVPPSGIKHRMPGSFKADHCSYRRNDPLSVNKSFVALTKFHYAGYNLFPL